MPSTKRTALSAATALAVSALALTACSSSPSDGTGPAKPADAAAKFTLNVWLMKDSAPDAIVNEVNTTFKQKYPNADVKVQILDWDGRDAKWKTALASDTPPDVMEMGNTDVLSYAATGALADQTGQTFENSGTWIQSLKDAGTYNKKLYGVPYYGGDRVVIYRKSLFAKAGITAPPATLADLTADAGKLASGDPSFSPFYFPGRYQYGALSFVFDTGGQIATQDASGKWAGALESPQAEKGLQNWADFLKAASKAPADVDESKPAEQDVFGQGKAAMILGQSWMVGKIKKDHPEIADDLDAFAMPGASGPMPDFIGGSNLAVAATTKNASAAHDWIAILTGTKIQTEFAQSGTLPNTTSLAGAVTGITATELKAATKSWFTPQSTNWSNVDTANVVQDMLQSIASGHSSVADAAKAADAKINQILAAS